MSQFSVNSENKIVRGAKRATYDRTVVFSIIDSATLCHVSTVLDGKSILIPTIHGRDEETLYIHGSKKSRMIQALLKSEACISFTIVDGLVLARSAFHHSMNYRSVILYGQMELVNDKEEKLAALKCITDQVLEGRWDEVRSPNKKEMEATSVLKVKIERVGAKVRAGGPAEEKEDYELPIWAGVVPIESKIQPFQKDPLLNESINVSKSVLNLYK